MKRYLAAGLAGCALGFCAGRIFSPENEKQNSKTADMARSSTASDKAVASLTAQLKEELGGAAMTADWQSCARRLARLAEVDPQAALGILSASNALPPARRKLMETAALEGWSRISPAAAAAWLLAQPHRRLPLSNALISNVASQDPQMALRLVGEICDSSVRSPRLADLMARMAFKDLNQSAVELQSLAKSNQVDSVAYREIYDRLALRSPELALRWVKEIAPHAAADDLDTLSVSLTRSNPRLALDLSLQSMGGPESESLRDRIEAAKRDGSGDYRTSRLSDSWGNVIRNSAAEADKFLNEQPEDIRSFFQTQTPVAWMGAKPEQSIVELNKLTPDLQPAAARAMGKSVLTGEIADRNLEFVEHLPAGRVRDAYLQPIMERLAATDPKQARKWLPRISDEEMKTRITAAVVSSQAKKPGP